MTEKEIDTTLALPNKDYLESELQAVRDFQSLAQKLLIKGHDFGTIPGTQKPTLLKPGAEKIAKLLGLSDHYEVLENTREWDKPFFHFTVKCALRSVRTGQTISEGLGECNSYEARYRYRWVFPSQLPGGKPIPEQPSRKAKTGTQYRVDNDDIYAQVNTILKMAKKRALVDAALSAGRLSDVFTQDMEDIAQNAEVIEAELVEAKEEPSRSAPQPRNKGKDIQDMKGQFGEALHALYPNQEKRITALEQLEDKWGLQHTWPDATWREALAWAKEQTEVARD